MGPTWRLLFLADRNSARKHVWRARIILATAEGCSTMEIMRWAGVSKPCVWRWQRRFGPPSRVHGNHTGHQKVHRKQRGKERSPQSSCS